MMGNPGAPTRAVGGAADGTVKSVACVALAVLCVLVVASASLGREGAGASRLARRYSPESYSAVKPASAVLGAERAELGFTAYEPARAEELLFDDDASARLSTAVLLSGGAWSSAEPEAYDAGEEAGAFPDAPSGAGAGAGTVAPPPQSASASAADAAGESLGELEGFSEEEGEGEGEGAEAEAGDSSAQAGGLLLLLLLTRYTPPISFFGVKKHKKTPIRRNKVEQVIFTCFEQRSGLRAASRLARV